MVFNTIFNNISVISWQSALLGDETRIPGEYHRPATNHCQTLSHKVALRTPRHVLLNLTSILVQLLLKDVL
jgi:hypothetical protein